jgi:hypothetical protein
MKMNNNYSKHSNNNQKQTLHIEINKKLINLIKIIYKFIKDRIPINNKINL